MFRDRTRLHKHGYQHRVVRIFDRMMLDAWLAADPFLNLSSACENPDEFAKLKDLQVETLMRNCSEAVEANKILRRIDERDHYKVNTTKIEIMNFSSHAIYCTKKYSRNSQ